jgi:rhodanese-related sulfurtransferase
MTKTPTSAELVARAQATSRAISVEEAFELLRTRSAEFIDVRGALERQSKPRIPGSVHADRGLLEFHLDPASDFHEPILQSGRTLIFVCNSGSRGALAAQTAREMGVSACYLDGGMKAWVAAGGATE